MNLSESDAAYAADQFIDYFSNMGRIDEYLRNVKLDRMSIDQEQCQQINPYIRCLL